jgi:hypothetical protein
MSELLKPERKDPKRSHTASLNPGHHHDMLHEQAKTAQRFSLCSAPEPGRRENLNITPIPLVYTK